VIERGKLLDALRSDPRTNAGARLDNISVTRRDQTGRAEQITIEGEQRRVVRGWDFKIIVGRALGWNNLKSSRFAVTRAGHDFVFRGSGFGHGLGLCQEGAHVMAQRGIGYRQILEHYFPGAKVMRTSEGAQAASAALPQHSAERLRLSVQHPLDAVAAPRHQQILEQATWKADLLPSSQTNFSHPSFRKPNTVNLASEHFRVTYPAAADRRDAEVVLRTLETTRADLMRRIATTSVAFAPLPTIDVYINDTTGDFVGRTGQPWWAAAATRGNRIELQPLALLKSRGVLTSTLRHELAHAFIDAVGHDRAPRWLAEGLALYLAGEGKMISRYARKDRSPTVREGSVATDILESGLSQSGSAEEMRALYAAAYGEVIKLVTRKGEGEVWRQLASY
jgi:hypothetical protein